MNPRELFKRGFDTTEIATMLKRPEFEVYNELGFIQGSINPPMPAATYEDRKAYMRKYYRTVTRPKLLAERGVQF
ncbi:hypothetical protein [Rhizobium leguminosarum]